MENHQIANLMHNSRHTNLILAQTPGDVQHTCHGNHRIPPEGEVTVAQRRKQPRDKSFLVSVERRCFYIEGQDSAAKNSYGQQRTDILQNLTVISVL